MGPMKECSGFWLSLKNHLDFLEHRMIGFVPNEGMFGPSALTGAQAWELPRVFPVYLVIKSF